MSRAEVLAAIRAGTVVAVCEDAAGVPVEVITESDCRDMERHAK